MNITVMIVSFGISLVEEVVFFHLELGEWSWSGILFEDGIG